MLNILAWLFFGFGQNQSGENNESHSDHEDGNVLNASKLPERSRKMSTKEIASVKIEEYLMEKSWEAVNSEQPSTLLLSSNETFSDDFNENGFVTDLIEDVNMQPMNLEDEFTEPSERIQFDKLASEDIPQVASTPVTNHVQSNIEVKHSQMRSTSPSVSLFNGDINGDSNRSADELLNEEELKMYKSSMYVKGGTPNQQDLGRYQIQINTETNDNNEPESNGDDRVRSDSWEKLDESLDDIVTEDLGQTKIKVHVGKSPVVGRTVVLDSSNKSHANVSTVTAKSPAVVKITHTTLAKGNTTPNKHVDTFKISDTDNSS